MIDLYTWTTPNGRKISIALEEMGLPYQVKPINIGKNEQFSPEFLAVSPNNKIPVIVDHDAPGGPLSIFESAAILTYLGDKTGQFLPREGAERYKVLEWLAWQVGGLGPMVGQLGYFALRAPEKVPLAIDRFTEESARLLTVMDRRLADSAYLGGDDYSIADMAAYPWTVAAVYGYLKEVLGPAASGMTALHRWLEDIRQRPAIERGMAVPKV